jgi:hypothetical protein
MAAYFSSDRTELGPFRFLARPFAPILTLTSYAKYLHVTKQSDPALKEEVKDTPTNDHTEVAARDLDADLQSVPKDDGLETRQDGIQTPAVRERRMRNT